MGNIQSGRLCAVFRSAALLGSFGTNHDSNYARVKTCSFDTYTHTNAANMLFVAPSYMVGRRGGGGVQADGAEAQ